LEKSYAATAKENLNFLDLGFVSQVPCEFCQAEGPQIYPMVRKGTAPYQLFLRECGNCRDQEEVDKWGRVPTQKDAECQVEAEMVDLLKIGCHVPTFGRNTAQYRESVMKRLRK
jgi:hypothetical protein